MHSFLVGEWRADPSACALTRDGKTVNLEPKVMDLLVLLHSEPGKVFSREEIDAALWIGVTVGEDTLARAVSKLRRDEIKNFIAFTATIKRLKNAELDLNTAEIAAEVAATRIVEYLQADGYLAAE